MIEYVLDLFSFLNTYPIQREAKHSYSHSSLTESLDSSIGLGAWRGLLYLKGLSALIAVAPHFWGLPDYSWRCVDVSLDNQAIVDHITPKVLLWSTPILSTTKKWPQNPKAKVFGNNYGCFGMFPENRGWICVFFLPYLPLLAPTATERK